MYCEKCGVKIDCAAKKCPLCHSPIEQDESAVRAFPEAKIKRIRFDKFSLFYWITAGIIAAVLIAVNLVTNKEFLWSAVVLACLVYLYYSLRFSAIAQKKFNGIVFGQTLALSALFIVIVIIGGSEYNLIAGLPLVYFLSEILLCVYIFKNKKEARKRFMSLAVMGILGAIPVCAAYIFDISVKWPSIAASALSGGVAIITLVAARKYIAGELKRYFHR